MIEPTTEVIVQVGTDGGVITLVRSRTSSGRWRFLLTTDESSLASIFNEEDLPGELTSTHGPAATWKGALGLLGKYGAWPFLYPLSLHPEFRDRILAEVRRLGGEEEEERWVGVLRLHEEWQDRSRMPEYRSSPTPRLGSRSGPLGRADFLTAVQSRVARIAVGASTVRGRGNRGSVAAARAQLRTINLRPFGEGLASFREALDIETERLRNSLPESARSWGLARKLINIFLRDCLYNTYLNEEYHLYRSEFAFEIPLDSITGKELDDLGSSSREDSWPGVKYLTRDRSDGYQAVAEKEAANYGLARVHLDSVWWSLGRDDED